MGLSGSQFFIAIFAALLPTLSVVAALMLVGVYLIRRKEIGNALARREIKITAVLLLILIPTLFFFAYLLVTILPDINPILIFLTAVMIAAVIGYPIYWSIKTGKAKESELFQVPVKASSLILFSAILWPVIGIFHLFIFFIYPNPYQPLLIVGCFLVGLLYAVMWLRPIWHVTEAGIYWHWAFIKWEKIVDQDWQPRDEKEVLLRLHLQRWLPIKIPVTQLIPIDYERPLKAIIQKYAKQETTIPPLSDKRSTL